MNRIYRSIWNEKTGMSIAASEIAQSHGSPASLLNGAVAGRTNAALEGLALFLLLIFSSNAFALPTNGAVSAGNANITAGIGSMTINQSSQNAAINWQSFGIGAGEAVSFIQPNSSAITLNRVLGSDPSHILGSLSANGNVFLINPNGVIFGQGAQINVGGLVASTQNITDSDFMAGRFKFSGTSTASIINQGTITARDGGYVALLGANVSNEGMIAAKLGTVALAAGEAATLDVAGDGLLNVTIDQGAVNALAENGGLIRADGGQVLMTTQAAGNLLNTVVNNIGVIQAQTIENHNGVIKLLGDMGSGTVNVGGTLDASAPNGGSSGSIETSAAHVNINATLLESPNILLPSSSGNITWHTFSLAAADLLTLTDGTGLDNNNNISNPTGLTANITVKDTTASQSAIASVISTSLNIPSPANINTPSNPGSSSSNNESTPSGTSFNNGSAPKGEYSPSPASGGPAGVDFTVVDAGANTKTADLQN
jgi:filamentous hemagglutinin family protein